MAEFHVHAASDEMRLDHRTAEVAAVYLYQNRFRAILRMAPDPGGSVMTDDKIVEAILRLHFEHGGLGQIAEVDAPLDLALDDGTINFVAQVLVRLKHPAFNSTLSIKGFGMRSHDYLDFWYLLLSC